MGQSASQPTSKTHENGILSKPKTDLFELDNDELQILLTSSSSSSPLTAQAIQMVARSLAKTEPSSQDDNEEDPNANPMSKTKSGFYSQETDSPEAKLAVRLHGLSKELAQFRFHLVPSRLKEPVFWQATFDLLRERLAAQTARYQLDQIEKREAQKLEHEENGIANNNNNNNTTNGGDHQSSYDGTRSLESSSYPDDETDSKGYSSDDDDDDDDHTDDEDYTDDDDEDDDGDDISNESQASSTTQDVDEQLAFLQDVEETLALRNAQIATLTKEVQKYKLDIARLVREREAGGGTTTTVPPPQHKGTWMMDVDSQEFLKYHDELKENMRREKQKRLAEVRHDMKFILDSDKIEDTNGHWNCCGAAKYHTAECNPQNGNR
jgi:hypothetical protein